MRKPRVVFFGCTKLSEEVLDFLIQEQVLELVGVVTSPEAFKISYSVENVRNYNFADLTKYRDYAEWLYVFDKTYEGASNELVAKLSSQEFDLILVVGWYYMVSKRMRETALAGAWGLHASLLPKYAGGAPLVWAMINQETETGVSLFKLHDGVDDGPIVKQEKFKILEEDLISNLLQKAATASKKIILESLKEFPDNILVPQNLSDIKIWPQRSPLDGVIDFNKTSNEVLAFIRAQSRPYPGAFFKRDGKLIRVWKARKFEKKNPISPEKLILPCGDGVEIEIEDYSIEPSI